MFAIAAQIALCTGQPRVVITTRIDQHDWNIIVATGPLISMNSGNIGVCIFHSIGKNVEKYSVPTTWPTDQIVVDVHAATMRRIESKR